MSTARLHLAIPGLLGPWPAGAVADARLPVLETLLARARRRDFPGRDTQALLFRLFDVTVQPPPTAAVSCLGDGLPARDGYWLHADPVHLRTDMDRIILFDSRTLAIEAAEAEALTALLNDHFADRGWHLEAPTPERWYLHLAEDPRIQTSPLHAVTGRSLFPFLPRGERARNWHALLNEVQMLLFHAPVNQRRRDRGQPEIGSLWPWGGGYLPPAPPNKWEGVTGRNPLLTGLCRLSGTPLPAPPVPGAPAAPTGETLVLRDDLERPLADRDPAAWSRALAGLEPLLAAALAALRGGRLAALLLYPGDGHRLELTRGDLRRFWRRRRPLTAQLHRTAAP